MLRLWKAVILVPVGLALLALPPTGLGVVRTDLVDENYLSGYLYWNDGRGGIAWGAPLAAAEDDVDPGHRSAGLFDAFDSQPLPQAAYLNVSRVIHVDLFAQGEKAAKVDVELRAGSDWLSGGMNGVTDEIRYCPQPSNTVPCSHAERPAAAGYAVTSHRLHAEREVVPKGAVLTLRVIHQDTGPIRYGLGGSHASVVRLPLFSPDEVLYRLPRYQEGGHPPVLPRADPGLLDYLPPPLRSLAPLVPSALAAFPFPAPRRRARGFLLGVLLLAGAASGCVESPGPVPQSPPGGSGIGGTARTYVIEDAANETGFVNRTHGSVVGIVSDADFLPVNGAFCFLVGTPVAKRTDPYGRFQLRDLLPGEYRLRIERAGFKPFEGAVRIEPAAITKVEITLEFVNPEERDRRPHRHDAWFDDNGNPVRSKVVTEITAPMGSSGSALEFAIPPPAIVLPGTVEIEINVTWAGQGVVRIAAQRGDDVGNATSLYWRASGVPFRLRTAWEMTDPGHALYTYWGAFHVRYPDVCTLAPSQAGVSFPANPGCDSKELNVKVILHKGVVPLEPPHPDRWGDADVRPIVTNQTAELRANCTIWACPFSQQGRHVVERRGDFNASWGVRGFLPYESQWFEAIIVADRHLVALESQTPWTLYYRTPETGMVRDCDQPQYQEDFVVVRRAVLATADPEHLTWTWRTPIAPGHGDPPYARRSLWCFWVTPTDVDTYFVDWYYAHSQTARPPVLTLSVTAHRGPL